jgi:hypothetical protein
MVEDASNRDSRQDDGYRKVPPLRVYARSKAVVAIERVVAVGLVGVVAGPEDAQPLTTSRSPRQTTARAIGCPIPLRRREDRRRSDTDRRRT